MLLQYENFIGKWRELLGKNIDSKIFSSIKDKKKEEQDFEEIKRIQKEILYRFIQGELKFCQKDDNNFNNKVENIIKEGAGNYAKIKEYITKNNIVLRDNNNSKPYDTIDENNFLDEDSSFITLLLRYIQDISANTKNTNYLEFNEKVIEYIAVVSNYTDYDVDK